MSKAKTILVVDEIEMFRELEAAILVRTARVLTAEGGEQALEIARREQPEVMIVDLLMRDCDGAAVCRAAKSDPALRGMRVVVVLSTDLAEDRARAIRAGADEVLCKPIHRMELIEVSRRLLRDPVQGAPRAALSAPIRIASGRAVEWGRARNLSRGGVFVEAERTLPLETEVQLDFRLPDTPHALSTSAKVIWCRPENGATSGMGLRFVALDGASARRVKEYVYEHAPPVREPRVSGA